MLSALPSVLALTAPVFSMIGLGWLARRSGRAPEAALRVLNDFCFRLALPALLFASASGASVVGGRAALAFFAGCLPVYAGAILFAWRVLRLRPAEAGLFGLNAAFGNTLMMGIPLVLAAYGRAGLDLLLGIVALHAVVLLPPAIVIAEIALNARSSIWRVLRNTLLSVARNPVIAAVVAGTLWSLWMPPLPLSVRRSLELLGAAAPPVALFCIGGSLVGAGAGRRWLEPALVVAIKLLALPLAVWLSSRAFGLDPLGTAVAVTVAGLPTGANAVVLARRYLDGDGGSGAVVLLGTLGSLATLAVILAWFGAA